MRIPSFALGLLLVPAAFAGPAGAQSADAIQLPDVLQVAVRQSAALAAARIDLDIARAQVVTSLGIEDFLLQATGSYFRQADEAVEGNIIGTDASSEAAAEISVAKLLSTGGTVSLHARSARRSSTLTFNDSTLTEYNSRISANIDQPLLRGRGRSISHAVQRQAKHILSAAELELEADARDEIQQIINAYWELVWAHKDLEIRVSALELALERRRLTDSSIKLGSAPQTALLEVDQVLATSEEDILLAQQRVTERSLELRRLAGLEIGPGNLDLVPSEELMVSPQSYQVDTVVGQAIEVSPELAALSERGESASIEVEVNENGKLPRLDLNLSAGPLGTDSSLGGSLDSLVRAKGYFVGGTLFFEQSLGSHTAEGRTREAAARLSQVRLTARDLRAQIATAASLAVQSANIAGKRMELSRRAMSLSEQNIEAERRRFESGKATNFDVLQRQDEQKQARLRFARAAIDYLRAKVAIQALSGKLLEQYGISLTADAER